MKNKKGFTLIELLAVIIILAIIVLVAIPVILNMIESSRKSAAKDTAYGYIDAIEYSMGLSDIKADGYTDINIPDNDDDHEYYTVEEISEQNIKVKGKLPESGVIVIKNRRVESASLCIGKYKADYDGKEAVVTKSSDCNSTDNIEVVVPDETPCVLATETKNNKVYIYIDSVEDMYAFASSVNSGTDYTGKIVQLRNNLDFNDYTPEKKTKVCDNNDNGSGFTPIGTSSNPFKGTFEGNGKTLTNLNIDRTSTNYVGLFGYIKGAIVRGLIVDNSTVKGYTGVGTVVGVANDSEVSDILVHNTKVSSTGTESSQSNTGGLVGILTRSDTDLSQIHDVIIRDSEVSAVSCSTGGELGRIMGSSSEFGTKYINKNIIVENTKVTAGCSNGADKGLVSPSGWISYSEKASFSVSSLLNNASQGGFANENINDINFYEALGLDTIINGTDDGANDLYYWDYDKDGEVVVMSIISKPLPKESSLEKDGDYLLIKNEKDWRKAATLANKNKKYRLEANLNFANKKYYMMGSIHHPFKGTFNGNAKTISNVTINANLTNYIGMFGAMKDSKVYALQIKNVTVKGYSGAGSLAGYVNDSEVAEILADNITVTTTGKESYQSNTGGLVGILTRQDTQLSKLHDVLIRNVTVSGVSCSVGGELGRIMGSSGEFGSKYKNENIIVENANVTANCSNGGDRGIISPPTDGWLGYYSNGYFSDDSRLNNTSQGGFASSNKNNLSYYRGKIETMYDGDTNNTGYFFDYVEDGKVGLVKAYTTTSGSTAVTQKVGYTKDTGDDKTAPTCTLNHVIVISNGFEYSFSCTDDVEIDKITSLFDHDPYNGQYNSSSWSTLGTEKNGTKSNSNKTNSYTSRWTTANSNPPQKGTCYYFSFGGKDKAGNYSGYHSNNCYQY